MHLSHGEVKAQLRGVPLDAAGSFQLSSLGSFFVFQTLRTKVRMARNLTRIGFRKFATLHLFFGSEIYVSILFPNVWTNARNCATDLGSRQSILLIVETVFDDLIAFLYKKLKSQSVSF